MNKRFHSHYHGTATGLLCFYKAQYVWRQLRSFEGKKDSGDKETYC